MPLRGTVFLSMSAATTSGLPEITEGRGRLSVHIDKHHAKEYSFDVIEFTMRANECCFDEFEFRKTLMKVLKLN